MLKHEALFGNQMLYAPNYALLAELAFTLCFCIMYKGVGFQKKWVAWLSKSAEGFLLKSSQGQWRSCKWK